jgi:hypothetical protein
MGRSAQAITGFFASNTSPPDPLPREGGGVKSLCNNRFPLLSWDKGARGMRLIDKKGDGSLAAARQECVLLIKVNLKFEPIFLI